MGKKRKARRYMKKKAKELIQEGTLFGSMKPARRNPNPIVRPKEDIVPPKNPPVDLPGGAIVGSGAQNALGKPYPINTPVRVKSIIKPAKKLYDKPLFAKKPAKRTKKESWGYGLKAIGSAAAVVGALLGGRKLVETIKEKVTERRMQKFGEQGVGSSYKARQFRKQSRRQNNSGFLKKLFGKK